MGKVNGISTRLADCGADLESKQQSGKRKCRAVISKLAGQDLSGRWDGKSVL
jgi:hypothetical protein